MLPPRENPYNLVDFLSKATKLQA